MDETLKSTNKDKDENILELCAVMGKRIKQSINYKLSAVKGLVLHIAIKCVKTCLPNKIIDKGYQRYYNNDTV